MANIVPDVVPALEKASAGMQLPGNVSLSSGAKNSIASAPSLGPASPESGTNSAGSSPLDNSGVSNATTTITPTSGASSNLTENGVNTTGVSDTSSGGFFGPVLSGLPSTINDPNSPSGLNIPQLLDFISTHGLL